MARAETAATPVWTTQPGRAIGRGDGGSGPVRVRIYHNPRCSKSRRALELIRARGLEPEIVLYLESPPTREALDRLLRRAGLTPREVLRVRDARALGLDPAGLSDEELLDLLVREPRLLERPLVETDRGVVLARPPERVAEVL